MPLLLWLRGGTFPKVIPETDVCAYTCGALARRVCDAEYGRRAPTPVFGRPYVEEDDLDMLPSVTV